MALAPQELSVYRKIYRLFGSFRCLLFKSDFPTRRVVQINLFKEYFVILSLKPSFEQIEMHQEGKINLKTIEDVLAELS